MRRVTTILCPLLVGRDEILELADQRIEEVAAGHGRMLLISGEAGIGKSRLVDAIQGKAAARGFAASGGYVAPQDRNVPAAEFLDLARNMLREPEFADLGRELLHLRDEVEEAGQDRRRRLVFKVVDQLLPSPGQPITLLFEDLQWADDLSLEIIGELARSARERPLFLIGAYRSDELGSGSLLREWHARLVTQRIAEEVRLEPLTIEQTALMTTLILNTGLPASRDVVSAVYDRTDGIPLHVEELLGALGVGTRIDGRSIRDASVPATIEDAVLARFERLSPEAQAAAQTATVIGRCFVTDVLAAIMNVPADDLDGPLRELVDQSFLIPPGARELWDFRHELLRDTLYRGIPPGAQRRLHARVAEFGAELEGASEIHASVHYERAGLRAQAFRTAVAGARAAAALSSHREAFELYRRAVANVPDDLPPGEAGEIWEAYWVEGFAIDLSDEPIEAMHMARARFLEAGRGVDAANQLIGLAGEYRREAYPLDQRRAILAEARGELEALPASPERDDAMVGMLTEEAQVATDAMDLEYARSAASEGAAIARRLGDEGSALFAETWLGIVDVIEGRIDAGLERMTSAAIASAAAGFEDAGITAFRNTSMSAIRALEYRVAAASIAEGTRYADKIQQSHCRHVMAGGGALLDWAAGRWDAAVAFGGQELANPGCTRGKLGCEVALGYVAFGRGEYDQARVLLGNALTRGEHSGAIDLILPALWGLAETELHSGNAAAAAERCTDAFERATALGEKALLAPFAVTGIRAFLATGRPDAADRWAETIVAQIGGWSPNVRPAVDHVKGLAKLAAGSTGVAREMLEAAVHGWDDRGRIWEATWARLDLAGCLLRSNRVGEAAGVLAVAGEVSQRLGSPALLARTEELARAARNRGALDEPWRPLTGREFEVARLIADGLTNAEIAGELSISPKTASAHVEHILAKLAVARRAEIAAWVTTVSRPKRT